MGFVAAAGNGGSSSKLYPASYPALMSVAAFDSNKNKASFSQYNDQVEKVPQESVSSHHFQMISMHHGVGPQWLLLMWLAWLDFFGCTFQSVRTIKLEMY